ncbi:hypothetical protein HpCOL17_08540 [Helicobacter pylori]
MKIYTNLTFEELRKQELELRKLLEDLDALPQTQQIALQKQEIQEYIDKITPLILQGFSQRFKEITENLEKKWQKQETTQQDIEELKRTQPWLFYDPTKHEGLKLHKPIQEQQITTEQEVEFLPNTDPNIIPISSKNLPIEKSPKVILNNDIYKVNLGKFGILESNLLFAIFAKLKNQQGKLITFDLNEVKEMIGNKNTPDDRVIKTIKTLWRNIKGADFWIILPKREENHMLFSCFAINYYDDEKTQFKDIEIQVNTPYFGHLLNELTSNFTKFELLQYHKAPSKYAKTLFRYLKKYENQPNNNEPSRVWGTYRHDFEGFMKIMGIRIDMRMIDIEIDILFPMCSSLANKVYDINSGKIIHKDDDESKPYYTIGIEKVYIDKKGKRARGNKVQGISFTYYPKPKQNDPNNRIQIIRKQLESTAIIPKECLCYSQDELIEIHQTLSNKFLCMSYFFHGERYYFGGFIETYKLYPNNPKIEISFIEPRTNMKKTWPFECFESFLRSKDFTLFDKEPDIVYDDTKSFKAILENKKAIVLVGNKRLIKREVIIKEVTFQMSGKVKLKVDFIDGKKAFKQALVFDNFCVFANRLKDLKELEKTRSKEETFLP